MTYEGDISWIASPLAEIANMAQTSSIRLEISIFVTCLCDPESVPHIPCTTVTMEKPSVGKLIEGLMPSSGVEGGGLAVVASGPPSLAKEVRNLVAGLSYKESRRLGGVGVHTEVFTI